MKEDKRAYKRLIVDCSANRDFTKDSSTMILDIGPEGIGFTVDERLDMGKYVFLDVNLGDEERVELSVQILWVERIGDSSQYRVGGKIRDAKKEDLEKFVRFYCERLMPIRDEEDEESSE